MTVHSLYEVFQVTNLISLLKQKKTHVIQHSELKNSSENLELFIFKKFKFLKLNKPNFYIHSFINLKVFFKYYD